MNILRFVVGAALLLYSLTGVGKTETLRILVFEGYISDKHLVDFEKEMFEKYGKKVKVEQQFITDQDTTFRAVRSGNVDLVSLTHNVVYDGRYDYIKNNLLIPINTKIVTNYKNIVNSIKDTAYSVVDGAVYTAPFCHGPYGLAYNRKQTKIPMSWNDLWKPENSQKYVVGLRESLYNVSITALALGYPPSDLGQFEKIDNPQFRKKLSQLIEGAAGFWKGSDTAVSLKGNKLAAAWGDSFSELRRQGEEWSMATPKEGTLRWVDTVALTKALRNKPFLKQVSEEFINSLLSEKYQVETLARELQSFPVLKGIGAKLTPKEKKRIEIISNPQNLWIDLPTLSVQDRDKIQRLWLTSLKKFKKN